MAQRPEVACRRLRGGYGLGVVFDPHRARNGITFTNHVFALMSIAIESTASRELAGEQWRSSLWWRDALGAGRRHQRQLRSGAGQLDEPPHRAGCPDDVPRPVVRVGGVRRADQDPQSGRVDEADSGQVEQRGHSVRPCRVERRAQAVRGAPVELAASSYEAGLLERLDRDSEKRTRDSRKPLSSCSSGHRLPRIRAGSRTARSPGSAPAGTGRSHGARVDRSRAEPRRSAARAALRGQPLASRRRDRRDRP